jgi:hypothetical protein
MTETLNPSPTETMSNLTVLEKLRKRKFLVLGAMALSALSITVGNVLAEGVSSGIEKAKATASFKMPSGEKIDFSTWRQMQLNQAPRISPDQHIQALIDTRAPLFKEIGLDPNKISDAAGFANWVKEQMSSDPKIANMGKTPQQMDAKELVEASALITADNLSYSWNVDANAKSARQPMDKILENHLPAECETYSATQQAVFNQLKAMYPEKLANTYLTENYIGTDDVMHYVNTVVQVQSPTEISTAFTDPTALDVSGKISHAYLQAESSVTLQSGLADKGISVN